MKWNDLLSHDVWLRCCWASFAWKWLNCLFNVLVCLHASWAACVFACVRARAIAGVGLCWEQRSECFYLEVVSQAQGDRKRWTFELGERPAAISALVPKIRRWLPCTGGERWGWRRHRDTIAQVTSLSLSQLLHDTNFAAHGDHIWRKCAHSWLLIQFTLNESFPHMFHTDQFRPKLSPTMPCSSVCLRRQSHIVPPCGWLKIYWRFQD